MKELINAINDCKDMIKELSLCPQCELRDSAITFYQDKLNALEIHYRIAY